jgi:hypothetical protein
MTPAGATLRNVAGRRLTLWIAFVLVHVWLGVVNLTAASYPMNDVTGVYRHWTDQAVLAGYWVGIDGPFVYPVLALVPMLAARALGPDLFGGTWLAIVLLVDSVAFATITGWLRTRGRPLVAWWWIAFLLLLGPIAVGRIDSITVPLAIVGLLLLSTRPTAAAVVLAVATWTKVWPAALLAAIVVAARTRAQVAAAAVGTTLAIVVVALAFGSGAHVLSFFAQQAGRGLQVEAPVTTFWMWRAMLGADDTEVYFDRDILTYQVRGPGVEQVAALMTPVLAVVALLIVLLGIRAVRRGTAAVDLLPPLALALVVTLIAVNKVGSPQFVGWIAAPVVLGLVTRTAGRGIPFRTPAVLALLIAALTQLVYPYLYGELIDLAPALVVVLAARNVMFFVLLGWAVRAVVRLPARTGHSVRQGSDDNGYSSPSLRLP